VNSPRDAEKRGGSVVIDVPYAGEVVHELTNRNILVDYRPGAGIRIGPHFFNTDEELETIMGEIKDIMDTKAYERHLTGGSAKF
jgi:kynureninase